MHLILTFHSHKIKGVLDNFVFWFFTKCHWPCLDHAQNLFLHWFWAWLTQKGTITSCVAYSTNYYFMTIINHLFINLLPVHQILNHWWSLQFDWLSAVIYSKFICIFMELNLISVHKCKKELGQYPTILSSCFVNDVYVAVNFLSQIIFVFLLDLAMVMYANEVETRKIKISWDKKH